MLYLIYDAAQYGSQQLYQLLSKVKNCNMLFHPIYDAGLEWVAPWIFSVTDDDLESINKEQWNKDSYYLIESKASLLELTNLFSDLIYQKDPQHAISYFRCWDIQVLIKDLLSENSECKKLFQYIDKIYNLSEDNIETYYLDVWGKLHKKTINHLLEV